MIKVTRLKGDELSLNPDLIETIEETPDTVITLVDGKKVIVRENPSEVANRIAIFRATILSIVSRLETPEAGARS